MTAPCEKPYAPERIGDLVLKLRRNTAIQIGENIRIEWIKGCPEPTIGIVAPQGMKITRVKMERKPR